MKIQVSTIAKPRDSYTTKFSKNLKSSKAWTPRKPSVFKTLKFENASFNPSDYYAPVCISYKNNDTFIAPNNPCVVFVLCVGASGYGSDTKALGNAYNVPFTNPIGGWQIRNQVKHKFEAHNKSSTRKDYIHNPPQNVATPSSFGSYISSNAGLNIAENTITMYQIYRSWLCTGWDGWWALGDRYRRSYTATETQNVNLASGDYDGDLLGCDGEVKFGIFRLNANEVVPIVVGNGFVKGHVDIVYFELRNGNDEAITKPSAPNDITANIPIKPTIPITPIIPPKIPLTLGLNPTKIELEIGNTQTLEIITNADTFTSIMSDDTIASFDSTTKEITANNIGETMLTIEGIRDTETIRRAVAIKVIDIQTIPPSINPPAQLPQMPKSIYHLGFNIDNFGTEQLAYMYANSLAFNDIFNIAMNNGNPTMVHNPINETRKQELQDIYNNHKNADNLKSTLKIYATAIFGALSNYIAMYPFYANKNEAHLQTLEDLIQENNQTIQGQRYSHEFKENVRNMPNSELVDKITEWITELDGVIIR